MDAEEDLHSLEKVVSRIRQNVIDMAPLIQQGSALVTDVEERIDTGRAALDANRRAIREVARRSDPIFLFITCTLVIPLFILQVLNKRTHEIA